MMDAQTFDSWCKQLGLSKAARAEIEVIRSSPPSRSVDCRGGSNVRGDYPSRKMGVTIQFESHKVELARIYELEYDPDVLEYYDQPPSFEIDYQSKSGKRCRHPYTPDFFVIRKDSAGWEECKDEKGLEKAAEKSPNRYQKVEGAWRCPPAEKHADALGMYFYVWSASNINWIFHRNFVWLQDYICADSLKIDESIAQEITTLIKENEGITLHELLVETQDIDADHIYALIATNQIYADIMNELLANPEKVSVFSSQQVAQAFNALTQIQAPSNANVSSVIDISVGISIFWDGEIWEIVNTGCRAIGLLREDGKFIELPDEAFNKLIQDGKITSSVFDETSNSNAKAKAVELLRQAQEQDIQEAYRRYEIIQPYIEYNAPTCPTRTIRRWRDNYRQAEEIYGYGAIGLLPQHSKKGNYSDKIDKATKDFMVDFIAENYETKKQRSVLRVYQAFVEACESHEPPFTPPSRPIFQKAIKKRSGYQQTKKREGRRSAIQKEEFYWYLDSNTPKHGDRPFEIAHLDHTQLDIELVSAIGSLEQCNPLLTTFNHNLGRPWVTFMSDAYSRRLLAVYLTYEEPSYRSCLMAVRICVQRFKRLPQTLVIDNGPEFDSHYFKGLTAFYHCTTKHRPPAKARYGAVVERLFGTANKQLVHELQGNTKIVRKHRQVSKSVNPKNLANWSLEDLNATLCEWAYNLYDNRPHQALVQTPETTFAQGLAVGGSRLHCRVEYDHAFRILTLASPNPDTRKVQPNQGVKIQNIYYWSEAFRDPEVEKTKVKVRYDPFNIANAYAWVNKCWVHCISSYYHIFQGYSEKEIRLVSDEIIKRKKLHHKNTTISDKELANFLTSKEMQEGEILEQRLRAMENRKILQSIPAKTDGESTAVQASINFNMAESDYTVNELEISQNRTEVFSAAAEIAGLELFPEY